MWLQMGGHCEPGDTTLADAALREAAEESGIAGLTPAAGRPGAPGPASDPGALPLAPGRAVRGAGPGRRGARRSARSRWTCAGSRYDEVADVADESVVRLLEATRARL